MTPSTPLKVLKKFTTPLRSLLRGGNDNGTEQEVLMLLAEYDKKNLLISENKFDLSGELEELHRYRYNDHGHLLEHTLEIPADGISEKFVTSRNADGYPIEVIKYYGDDPGERTLYEYGTHSMPVRMTRFDADGEFEAEELMEYNDQSHLIRRKIISPVEGDKEYRFCYDEKGNITSEEEYDKEGKLLARMKIDYDVEGKETMVSKYTGEGKLVSQQGSEYDEAGRICRRISKGFYTRITEYVYDEQGRTIEEALSDGNGFVISRNRMAYNEEGRLLEEVIYETDLTRAGRDTHLSNRYEYEYF